MSLLGWIGVGVAAWLVCGTAIGLVLGRIISARERQVQWDCPRDDARPAPEFLALAERDDRRAR